MVRGPVYYDELMDRSYLVYYDGDGEPIFVVYDKYGDPAVKYPRLSKAQRKELEASLRAELELWNQRLGELYEEAGEAATVEEWAAIGDQARAEGMPDDLSDQLEALENYRPSGDRLVDVLMTYVLWGWFSLGLILAVLAATEVIAAQAALAGVWVLGLAGIIALAVATGWAFEHLPWISDRWG